MKFELKNVTVRSTKYFIEFFWKKIILLTN